MAGRPRTMAKRVTKLEDGYIHLHSDAVHIMPKKYITGVRPGPNDPIGRLWYDFWSTSAEALDNVEILAEALRAKAGIPEPYPIGELPEDETPDQEIPEKPGDESRRENPEAECVGVVALSTQARLNKVLPIPSRARV